MEASGGGRHRTLMPSIDGLIAPTIPLGYLVSRSVISVGALDIGGERDMARRSEPGTEIAPAAKFDLPRSRNAWGTEHRHPAALWEDHLGTWSQPLRGFDQRLPAPGGLWPDE